MSKVRFDDLLESVQKLQYNQPLIPKNEMFAEADLTENEIAIRQINCSKFLEAYLKIRI